MAPFFSIVAPAYNVEGTIRTALQSALDQSFTDFELIVVDDQSPDASGAIADEMALSDPRMRVVHLPENRGLGLARNAGMEFVTGEYVLYLDTDDWYEDGALEAIHHRIIETGRPEVAIFDYARAYWWGARNRNVKAAHLVESEDQPWTLSDHPELLEILNTAWNKAYSRAFLERTGLEFPPGIYEDIPFTFPVLMEARTIATVDFVALGYRQSRGGSILRSSSPKHLDVVKQWDATMNYIEAHPEHSQWHPVLYERLVNHLVNLAGNSSGRIPDESWDDFMKDVGRCLAEHRPPDFVFPDRAVQVRAEVLMRQVPLAFRSLKAVNGRRIAANKIITKQKNAAKRKAHQLKSGSLFNVHKSAVALPVDENLAIFSAYWDMQYAGNPRAIYEELRSRPTSVEGVWIFLDDPPLRFPADGKWVRRNSREYYWLLGRAKYLINNVNFADFVIKRREAIHVQTQHGTPLKSMGLDLRPYPNAAKGMSFKKLLRRSDRWDMNLSSNRYSTEVWARAFPCNFESFESGYPRNDVLINANNLETTRAKRRLLGAHPDRRALLYMPTFRDYDDGFEVDIDLHALATTLGSEWTVLVRAHYFYESGGGSHAGDEGRADLIDISDYPNVEDAYLASDVLLTDYSSAMFDYANLDRPIVLHVPDWDRYLRERGLYFDVRQTPPGPVSTTSDELMTLLATGAFEDAESSAHRHAFRELFCEFDDGRAAARVVDRLLTGERDDRAASTTDLSSLAMYPTHNWEDPEAVQQQWATTRSQS